MPKGLIRIYGQGDWHFITCSCYRRLPFLGSARHRDLFLEVLEQTRKKYEFVVAGYVVMPEHIHLLIGEPKIADPSRVMQVLKQACLAAVPVKEKGRQAGSTHFRWAVATRILAAPLS